MMKKLFMFFGIAGCPNNDDPPPQPNTANVINNPQVGGDTSDEANVSAVPEPATLILRGSGLAGLAGFGRKKFKKLYGMSHTLPDNGGRRSGIERREFSYYAHIPERRFGKERRSGLDRRPKPRTSKNK